ncbi:unnamed protein product [Kuraishia capsulata CBS 1993]|uniref:Uncharacterized protein n=1 Tax=Kuraishia capsulata CBS 1993 TaxID=1382522 RepID=W6MQJ7_9ASCO|nr:uncharacterized protein KUCA_T00003510001 [Kuraishia capsulata CBS 1993]CDK27532.1 unnamed protein product [Kuraishia capsulata CBS 1993]
MFFYEIRSKFRRLVIHFYHHKNKYGDVCFEPQNLNSTVREFEVAQLEDGIFDLYLDSGSESEDLREALQEFDDGHLFHRHLQQDNLCECCCHQSEYPNDSNDQNSTPLASREPLDLPILNFLRLAKHGLSSQPTTGGLQGNISHETQNQGGIMEDKENNPPFSRKQRAPSESPFAAESAQIRKGRTKSPCLRRMNDASLNAALVSSGHQPKRIASTYSSDFTMITNENAGHEKEGIHPLNTQTIEEIQTAQIEATSSPAFDGSVSKSETYEA